MVLLLLLGAMWLAVELELTELLAWTDRLVPVERYPTLFAAYFATWLLVSVEPNRRLAMLVGSVGTAAIFDLLFLALSIPWIWILHRLLFSRRGVFRATLFVIASYVAASFWLDWHTGYVFGVAYAFRVAWLIHEVHVQRTARMPFVDVFLYFVFAPFFLIVPYMLAIPRCDRFRAGLDEHDIALERSGMRLMTWGLFLLVLNGALSRVWDGKVLAAAYAASGDYVLAIAHGFPSYFTQGVLVGCGIAALLAGMTRVLGIDLAPAMNAPLLARSITEWWRRWNTHFRDLLVDLFYYPVVMRLRRRKRLAMVLGCAAVFLVGSSLFHWPKHHFRTGSWWPLGAMAENVVMFAMVAIAMLREQKKPARWSVLGAIGTFVMVYVAVAVVGYSVAHLQFSR